MSYDFSKLSRVPINESVSDETFSLVVNQDEVEKTPYGNVVSNVKDYTEDYNSYSLTHPGTSPVDFIRTLTPIRIDTQTVPRQGYLTYMYFYYTFEVFCSINSTWYKITEVNSNQSKLTEYLYSPTRLIEQVQKKYIGSNPDNGTYFITPIGFEDVRIFNCSGDANVSADLFVDGNSVLNNVKANSVHVGTSTPPYIDINSTTIDFTGENSGVQIKHDGNGNIVVSEGNSNTKITGLSSPTGSSDAVNKQYVDINIAELNGRIGNLVVGGESTEGEEIVVDVIDNIEISQSWVASSSVTLSGESTKLITAVWAFSGNDSMWHTENIEYVNSSGDGVHYTLSAYNLNDFYIASSYVKFMVIYSRKANLIVPELVDLRQPFNYTGPQNGVVSDYDDTATQYSPGDYCYSDEEDGVRRLYVCIDETDGQWQSGAWELATARDSIELALDNRLKKSGQDPMWGILNMNNHRIINVTNPTNGTDAATKAYVDNKTFSLDANGILNFG